MNTENKVKVIVAGAGAAGLMAAITAARAGAQVTVLEAMERPGRKLLLTGNGRCNLTNLAKELPYSYYGTGAALAKTVIDSFDAQALLKFFRELGLLVQEKNGYVYPYSAQSGSVLEVLLAEARRLKVKLKYSEKIVSIERSEQTARDLKNDSDDHKTEQYIKNTNNTIDRNHSSNGCSEYSWIVKTQTWSYTADALILACGSKAVPATGSDGSGYGLARQLGHSICTVAPALVPVTCGGSFLQHLAGVRCRAEVSLWEHMKRKQTAASSQFQESSVNMRLIRKETGELQWTKYGVSGIVVFQLSRFISLAKPDTRQYLNIDFLPEFSSQDLLPILVNRASVLREEKAGMLLSGLLNDKLVPVILDQTDKLAKGKKPLAKTICPNVTAEQLEGMIRVMKHFTLEVTGTKDFDVAQVCAGGVDCAEIHAGTMESKLKKGLYFAGELLDVDGPCGGYNLQWAWSSGYLAGKSAADMYN